jgi:ribonuclease P protein subunit RPR2
MARRIDRGTVSEIALIRIDKLMALSKERASAGDIEHAKLYVQLARRIGMRTKTKIPKEHRYCKNCCAPMTPDTSRVRLRSHRVVMQCAVCGHIKRIPYLREQGND